MTTVTLSDRVKAATALIKEVDNIETLQLECGEQIASLLLKQVRLAEKSKALKEALSNFVNL